MSTVIQGPDPVWRVSAMGWMLVGVISLSLGFIFAGGITDLIERWSAKEEYSHGFLIPVISALIVWLSRDELEKQPFRGSWLGVLICLGGVAVYFLGELSTLNIIIQYALIAVLAGVIISFVGVQGIRLFWVSVVFLIFMIPLPPFLYNGLSGSLQLISSDLGVWVIRMFDISVYLEGNVIDLGTYQLQVVEACNGLRYLFPLMSFGFLCAYLFKAPVWQRMVVFLSTIPITVAMNSFRIGVIGVLVEHWGQKQADGFLHDFEGWAIFMACVGVLFCEMWLLHRLFGGGTAFREVFGIELPRASAEKQPVRPRPITKPFIAATAVLVITALVSSVVKGRVEVIPQRQGFSEFATQLGEWQGKHGQLADNYLKALKLTDYAIIDYRNPADDWVNFYVAYYDSQRAGDSAHSPRSCIPGGGWKIQGLSRRSLEDVLIDGKPLAFNRVQIQKGDNRQLVYYWFQQRGRIITSEYLVKWFLFWDALTRNRSDGALVRLTIALRRGEQWSDADMRLAAFSQALTGELSDYVPD